MASTCLDLHIHINNIGKYFLIVLSYLMITTKNATIN
jgi:hypothetical protein